MMHPTNRPWGVDNKLRTPALNGFPNPFRVTGRQSKPSDERLEIPLKERLAAMRAQRAGGARRQGPPPRAKAALPRPSRKPAAGGRGQSRIESILEKHAPKSEAPARPFGRRRR